MEFSILQNCTGIWLMNAFVDEQDVVCLRALIKGGYGNLE